MRETRDFHLGDILSVITGKLVSPSHIDGVYRILNWMTGDNLYTHQLPRAAEECADPLKAQQPDLAHVTVPDLNGEADVLEWLATQVGIFGETRPVAKLHPDDHTHIDPFTEIRQIAPHLEVITVEMPDDGAHG